MRRQKAFTLIELLVVVGIIALLISILLPSLARARELSKRTSCQANVKSIGTACFIYQEDNLGVFPTAPAKTNNTSTPIISYMGGTGNWGLVGEGKDRNDETLAGPEGDDIVAITRSPWMLVREGAIVPKNFKCPSSEDVIDPTVDVTTYYDFVGFGAISYGYQVPYDQANAGKPSVDADPRMALVADRGPWTAKNKLFPGSADINAGFATDGTHPDAILNALWSELTTSPQGLKRSDRSPPEDWKPFNSPNHGGAQQGEGESVLFPDIHAEFLSRPTAGVDGDNIYTQMADNTAYVGEGDRAFDFGMFWGNKPPLRDDLTSSVNYYPGDGSLGNDVDSQTDSLIYP